MTRPTRTDDLNQVIDYIENHLCEKIDFAELGKIAHTNAFILERVFMFLTNTTLTEYIKQRRLSKAFEEIRNTDQRVIDVALKYQYNSAAAFSRAFKKFFGVSPIGCRRGVGNYQIVPKKYFAKDKEYDFDYTVKDLPETTLYCYHATAISYTDMPFKIKQLYQRAKDEGRYAEFSERGMYGVYTRQGERRHYYLGSTQYFSDLQKFVIPAGKYVEFKLDSRMQNEIIGFENRIDWQWAPSTNYNVKKGFKVELYRGDDCYIRLLLKEI